MIGKRRLLATTTGLLVAGQARARKYPSDLIKLVVPRAPGGGSAPAARYAENP